MMGHSAESAFPLRANRLRLDDMAGLPPSLESADLNPAY